MHGHTMVVPAGWVHQVINLLPCVKVAVELLMPAELPLYFKALDELILPTGHKERPDYMMTAEQVARAVVAIGNAVAARTNAVDSYYK